MKSLCGISRETSRELQMLGGRRSGIIPSEQACGMSESGSYRLAQSRYLSIPFQALGGGKIRNY